MRFVEQAELAGETERAAVFSPGPTAGRASGPLAGVRRLFRTGPRPAQGLIIAKRRYDSLGGHRDGVADSEADLLRRLGRRRLAVLRTPAIMID
jgi:hypothetical protein